MATDLKYPWTTGDRHDHSSLTVKFVLPGREFQVLVTAMEWSTKRKRTKLFANHPKPLGKTKGQTDFDCSIEMFEAEWQMLRNELGDGWQDAYFSVVAQVAAPDFETDTTSILGCTLGEVPYASSAGGDPTKRKFTLDPLDILEGGLDSCDTQFIVPG